MTLAPYLPHGEVTDGVVSSAIGSFAKLQLGASDTLTASTTQTRAGALVLTKTISRLTAVANSGDAVRFPISTAGAVYIVINAGANPPRSFRPARPTRLTAGLPVRK